jgi:hypothetical protein
MRKLAAVVATAVALGAVAVVGVVTLSPGAAIADEGMWTYDNFPADKVRAKYGFAPDARWLEHARLASVRLAGGCSGSFVSPQGLVMTNHHCVHSCLEELSTPKQDLVKDGFYARTTAAERRCPAVEVNQLVAITDVTPRVQRATKGLKAGRFTRAQRAETARIEKECQTSPDLRCEVVTLYHGGAYHLYKYRRYQDVRVVFAPEFAIAFFGGDPDNFMFPRWDLDVSFVRVYQGGKPLATPDYFRWSKGGARNGELTFVTGNPGRTERLLTVAQLAYERDFSEPHWLAVLAEWRGLLTEFARRSPEMERISKSDLFGIENSFKARSGRRAALLDPAFFGLKVAAEKALRDAVAADPRRRQAYGDPWAAIARAVARQKVLDPSYRHVRPHPRNGAAPRFHSTLLGFAEALVRGAAERHKPNGQRLQEFREGSLPSLRLSLFSEAPIYDDLEIVNLAFGLSKLREDLGPDHPFVRAVLGKESPDELAARLVRGTRLKNIAERRRLWQGGAAAIQASRDPAIMLVRRYDAQARAIRQSYEDQVESVFRREGELLAKLRFELYGTHTYPDATFSPRISYGQVKGWTENGRRVHPFTDFAGAFARATGRPPFALPASWLRAKPRLNLRTPLNFCTDNDIIGGNSGSPMFNRRGEIVGLVFDGNLLSLGGDYGFDPAVNRTVAVHSEALLHALRVIYRADRVVKELQPR